jgi:hypothetical protein
MQQSRGQAVPDLDLLLFIRSGYWASRYFARLPFRMAESGSLSLWTVHFLSFPSDPAVTCNALAIRIVFPLVGVTPAIRRLGLPAMPGKPSQRQL